MVDVQPHYFGGTIDRVDLVIDHHPEQHGYTAVYKDIRADYGSTSTILTEHLRAVDANISERTATAMLYAIKSDTLFFNRQANRVDIEAFSYLYPLADATLIRKMEGAEITEERLDYVLKARQHGRLQEQVFCAFLGTTPREDFIPYVADFYLQLEDVQVDNRARASSSESLVMSVRNLGYSRNAGEFVRKYFNDIGSAGGHRAMAKAVVPLRVQGEVREPSGRRAHRARPRDGARLPARASAGREEAGKGLSDPLLEQRQVHGLAHRLVAGIARVQMIAGVVRRQELRRRSRIARHLVEVDHRRRRPLVRIHWLSACRFASPSGREVGRAFERRQRRAVDLQAARARRSMSCLCPAIRSSALGDGLLRAMPMSLIPSMTITCVTPVCISTSRSNRASALTPAPSPSTWLPLMPALSTATGGRLRAARRRARWSGQRLFVSRSTRRRR